MRPYWYIVEELSKISAEKPYRLSIHDTWIIVFRDRDNKLVAFEDKCLHKCTRLSGGTVKAGIIECPYHGWRYDSCGKLVDIPSGDSSHQLVGNKFLKKFVTKETQGYLYVWLGQNKPSVSPFKIPFLTEPGWTSIRLKNHFENTLSNCAENFLDIPHTAFVHPGIFRSRKNQKYGATIVRKDGAVHIKYHNEKGNLGWFSKFLNRSGEKIYHTDHFYSPNITCVEYRFPGNKHFFITSQLIEIETHKTIVFTDLTYNYGLWTVLSRPVVRKIAQRIIDQDIEILNDHGKSIKKYGKDYMNTPTDLIHLYIESILRKINSGVDPKLLSTKSSEIEFWV